MAEEIRLVGVFQDNITPQLKKLNTQINTITRSFEKFGKKLRPIAKEMGNLAAATERVADALKDQKKQIDSASRSWTNYKREVGKAGSATRKAFGGVGRGPTAFRPSRGGDTRGSGSVSRGGGGDGVVASTFGITLGNTIGNLAQRGVAAGFRMGVDMMEKPFRYLVNALGERINDEMQDIQSAGGMFALDKKNPLGERLFKGFDDARQMQERMNRALAKSAAALPGATNDYVRAARGLTDTVMMAFGKNKDAFRDLAVSLGGKKDGSDEEALTKVLQRFTEQTVLLGQGSSGGMPLTMLMEQMIQRESVNVESMKMRYGQLRQNPLLANMLSDAQAEINATAAGSAERFKAVMKALDRALPQEVVNSMRMSAAGVIEAINSGFLDPDTGLLGLGRELNLQVKAYDQFGKAVMKNGKAVEENTTLFKIVRDSLAGFVLPLSELVGILPELFDPLVGIADGFVAFREKAMKFMNAFTRYTNWFKENEFGDEAGARGALSAINNFLKGIGVFDDAEFQTNAKELMTKGNSLKDIGKRLLTDFFSSDFMKDIGEALGSAIGGVLSAIATVLTGVQDAAKAGPFAEGFKAGFDAKGGKKAIQDIMGGLIRLFLDAIKTLFENAPLETTGIVSAVVFGPAIIAAVSTWIIKSALPALLSKILGAIAGSSVAATLSGWLGGVGPLMAKIGAGLTTAGAAAKASLVAAGTGIKSALLTAGSGIKATLATAGSGIKASLAAAGTKLTAAGSGIKATLATAGTKLAAAGTKLATAGAGIKTTLLTAGAGIKTALLAAGAGIKSTLLAAAGGIKAALLATAGGIKAGLLAAAGGIKAALLTTGVALKSAIMTVVAPFAILAAKIMLIVAGVIGLILIIRNLDIILSSIGHFLVMFGAAVQAVTAKIIEAGANFAAGLLRLVHGLLSKVGMGGLVEGLVRGAEQAAVDAGKVRVAAEAEIVKRQKAIGANTQKSLKRTQEDFANLKTKMDAFGTGLQKTAEDLGTGVNKKAGEFGAGVNRRAGEFSAGVNQKAGEFGTWIGSQSQVLTEQLWALGTQMGEFGAGLIAEVGKFGTGLTTRLGTFGTGLTTELGKFGTGLTTRLEAFGTELTKMMVAFGGELNKQAGVLSTGVKENVDKLGVSMNSTIASMSRAANNLVRDFATAGAAIRKQATTPMFVGAGGPMGAGDPRGASGGGPIGEKAADAGLTMTSHMRPGDPGWHGVGRAWDYSNSTGPTSEMHSFATYLANNYGGNLKELIYTPLGYSIKDGQKVPPYAQEGHYNHVHVAYGMGANSPAFFNSQQDAIGWEKKVAPANSAIASVTSNSSEFSGGATVKVESINISGVNDPRAIANSVASEILYAIKRAENTELDIS